MDGLPQFFSPSALTLKQRTLKSAISCTGIGLHSGRRVQTVLSPAGVGHGIVFRRSDTGAETPARFDLVSDVRLATSLGEGAAQVSTVEHLMAALSALGVSNALVTVDGPELPILDGSAAPWLFLLECAGTAEQDAPQRTIEVLRPVRVSTAGSWAELSPADGYAGLELEVSIAFASSAIGTQTARCRLNLDDFRFGIAPARTFALARDVEAIRAAGLARGGSLENAVVVDEATVLNPGGLRMEDEFARHKLLDAIGDLALAGARLHGRFRGHRSGHGLHNKLLRALFADPANWRETAGATFAEAAE